MTQIVSPTNETTSLDPEFYKKTPKDRFNLNNDLEDIYKAWENLVPEEDWEPLKAFVEKCLEQSIDSAKKLSRSFLELRRERKKIFKKNYVLHVLKASEEDLRTRFSKEKINVLKSLLVKKAQKSTSGVLVVTVVTSPYPEVNGKKQKFSCEWNCYYCPNEPDQPRSYLHDEPSVLRANRNHFDAVLQFYDRVMTLEMNGHPVDKVELLVLGGTWSSYPLEYQESFVRDLFYAANTYFQARSTKRTRKSLAEEKNLNEIAQCKIIGLTLETRPDCITPEEIQRYRYYGCTRVQLGVQHTDNTILKKINRGCYRADVAKALQLLKDSCYKIDIHLMPNLPGASPAIDQRMFEDVLYSADMQADQWKIYPCETVPWTVIQKWFEKGKYVPYEENELMDVLKYAKKRVHPWIRLNRVIRDIPSQYILGGVDKPSMRQGIAKILLREGTPCKCIRCREVKDRKDLTQTAVLKIRMYHASGGLEYFISFETEDESTIFGFTRLRIPAKLLDRAKDRVDWDIVDQSGVSEESDSATESRDRGRAMTSATRKRRKRSRTPMVKGSEAPADFFPELENAALVRELHVYGQLVPVLQNQPEAGDKNQQHVGFGKQLMLTAETVALRHVQVNKTAVISGVGVRNFYRKIGYELKGTGEMMIKDLKRETNFFRFLNVALLPFFFILLQFTLLAYFSK